jgi:SAM-dependent methyltransferase
MRAWVSKKWPYARGFLRGHVDRALVRAGRALGRLVFSEPALRVALKYVHGWFRWYRWSFYRRSADREWFDHRINLYRWSADQDDTFWLERGVYASELLTPGARVLDLCCGDGFYAYHFYAVRAESVDAVDRDAAAIERARRQYGHPRLAYHVADVVADPFPSASYDVISWDAAVEHFADDARDAVLSKCADALGATGVLCGHTPLVDESEKLVDNPFHAHDYSAASELVEQLELHFPHVATFVTEHPTRRNVYFRASRDASRLGRFPASV